LHIRVVLTCLSDTAAMRAVCVVSAATAAAAASAGTQHCICNEVDRSAG